MQQSQRKYVKDYDDRYLIRDTIEMHLTNSSIGFTRTRVRNKTYLLSQKEHDTGSQRFERMQSINHHHETIGRQIQWFRDRIR